MRLTTPSRTFSKQSVKQARSYKKAMIINELPSPKHGDEGNDHAMMGSHREGEATETGDVEQESDRCGTYSLTSSKLVQIKES